MSCGARLAPFDIKEVREITSYDELDLGDIGRTKTALFVIISDTDDSLNFLVSIMYTQLFNLLCTIADDEYHGKLPVHVRCILDEFANIGQIPKFDKLTPVVVRGNDGDGYEMISGHRRLHASRLAGLKKIPAFVRELSDDEATIVMVDSNIQREELLPSEKAFALKMKLEAMRRQAGRPSKLGDNNSAQNERNLAEIDAQTDGADNSTQNERNLETAEIIGNEIGMSRAQVRRYIRLTELIPELLDLVDKKRLQFTCAVDISYFDTTIQKWLNEYIRENVVIKPIQIAVLRERAEKENIDQEKMIMILHNALPGRTTAKKVVMNEKKLRKYFPEEYTSGQMERVIEALLEQWSREQKGASDGI